MTRSLARFSQFVLRICLIATLLSCFDISARPLAIVITVDTLRADHLGAYGDTRGLTPNLDRLAQESQVFRRAYAPTSFTLASISTLWTGRYPEQNRIVDNNSTLAPTIPTLASALQANGWKTAAVIGNFVLRHGNGIERGFDLYDDHLPQRERNRPEFLERTAADTTNAALAVLDRLCGRASRDPGDPARSSPANALGPRQTSPPHPVFLWIHYQDPHGPYTPPAGYRERFIERERDAADGTRQLPVATKDEADGAIPRYQRIGRAREVAFYRAGYDGEIAFVDEQIGRFLDGLTRRGLVSNTLVVFTADHGEALGEHEYWFQHGAYLEDPLVHVPLLIRVPGRSPTQRQDVVGLIDLFETVLAYFALDSPPGASSRNLLGSEAALHSSTLYMATLGGSSVPRFGLVTADRVLLIRITAGQAEPHLFAHNDPWHDLSAREPKLTSRLLAQLNQLHWSIRSRIPATQRHLTPSERRKLEALGYVGGEERK